jgi:hypothetical protein
MVDSGGVAATNPSTIKRRIYPLLMADATALASATALSPATAISVWGGILICFDPTYVGLRLFHNPHANHQPWPQRWDAVCPWALPGLPHALCAS